MNVFIDSLGCPKALIDAERIGYFVEKENYNIVANPYEADIIIINTCGFIEKSKKESIETILQYHKLKKNNPNLKIIVSGCLSERYKNIIKNLIPEIDSFIGVRNQSKIIDAIKYKSESILDDGDYNDINFIEERNLLFSGTNYAYLKISEGCNRKCSFCIIPTIRGKQRSRKIEDIVQEAKLLINKGIKEIILVSEDTISYGLDLYNKKMICELLEALSGLDIKWIRILYLFPEKELLDIAYLMKKYSNICRYIDIPLQHASDKILKKMNRPGNLKYYKELIQELRNIIPEISIRTSFIVGFPDETDNDFEILKNFIEEMKLNRVGFFDYSDEEGTLSYEFDNKVKKREIQKRIKELYKIQEKVSKENLEKLINKKLLCINDGMYQVKNKNYLELRTEFDAPEIDGKVFVRINDYHDYSDDFYNVLIKKVKEPHDLIGELVY